MDYSEWEPLYGEILRDFGFSREEDEASARLLGKLIGPMKTLTDEELEARFSSEATILGSADCLEWQLENLPIRGTIISTGKATQALLDKGVRPDFTVSDLDGDVMPEVIANEKGAVAFIHAHGDNISALKEWVPRFSGVIIGTTQSRPAGPIRNYGGFTDGDRAVITARHFGVKRINLMGFDFYNPRAKSGSSREVKRRKLRWARDLIFQLNDDGVEIEIADIKI